MEYDRNLVIDKINTLKGKRGTKEYVSNEKIAEYLDVSNTTVKKWLKKRADYLIGDETGYPDIPFPYIVKLCDWFGCDIEYLLDKNMTCKTREVADINKATGLSESAIKKLESLNDEKRMLNDVSIPEEVRTEMRNDKSNSIFIELINHIIEGYMSRVMELDERDISVALGLKTIKSDDGYFPINQMVSYIAYVRMQNDYLSEQVDDRIFDLVKAEPKGDKDTMMRNIKEKLSNEGYTEGEILIQMIHLWSSAFESSEDRERRYKRVDVQDSFSQFLKSDFVEGENNGK